MSWSGLVGILFVAGAGLSRARGVGRSGGHEGPVTLQKQRHGLVRANRHDECFCRRGEIPPIETVRCTQIPQLGGKGALVGDLDHLRFGRAKSEPCGQGVFERGDGVPDCWAANADFPGRWPISGEGLFAVVHQSIKSEGRWCQFAGQDAVLGNAVKGPGIADKPALVGQRPGNVFDVKAAEIGAFKVHRSARIGQQDRRWFGEVEEVELVGIGLGPRAESGMAGHPAIIPEAGVREASLPAWGRRRGPRTGDVSVSGLASMTLSMTQQDRHRHMLENKSGQTPQHQAL